MLHNNFDDDLFLKIAQTEFGRAPTADLLFYETLESKKDLFGQNVTFDSSSQFLSFWLGLPNEIKNEEILFRGVQDASLRLFNKAQRNYIANKRHFDYQNYDYHDLISTMISNARNANSQLLPRYFKAFGVPDNDISILSYLQHYGAPTPLLDWSKDFDIALFFATSNLSDQEIEKHYMHPGRDIGSYFSIYLLNVKSIRAYINNFKPLNTKSKTAVNYDKIKKKKLAYIVEVYNNGKPKFYLENNFNILNQKGVFIYNNNSDLPLEEVIRTHSTLYYMFYNSMVDQEETFRSPLICINVNKGIIKHIKKRLTEKGITNDSVFPKPELIASTCVPPMLS